MQAAIEVGVPAYVLSAALYSRFESRGRAEFADKLLSAMRLGFGGHLEKKAVTWSARDSDALVIFGATGDLCFKKIFPRSVQPRAPRAS